MDSWYKKSGNPDFDIILFTCLHKENDKFAKKNSSNSLFTTLASTFSFWENHRHKLSCMYSKLLTLRCKFDTMKFEIIVST